VSIRYVFVYGTLRPGDVRWPLLAPFVVGAGIADEVDGELFDTGLDYPAAVFGAAGRIVGQTFELVAHGRRALPARRDHDPLRSRRVGVRVRHRPAAHSDPFRRLVRPLSLLVSERGGHISEAMVITASA
jgi:gamma-glutamylcyclotransferase (GGCT)/AIG2-like uncharacterized protein YtfP